MYLNRFRGIFALVASFSLLPSSVGQGGEPPKSAAGSDRMVTVRVPTSVDASDMISRGGKVVGNYGAFSIVAMPGSAVPAELSDWVLAGSDRIRLNSREIETRVPSVAFSRAADAVSPGKSMHLVQFAGPVRAAWVEELKRTGVEIVSYVPANAYLVYGSSDAIEGVRGLSTNAPSIQWEGEYRGALKIDAAVTARAETQTLSDAPAGDDGFYAIQLFVDPAVNAQTVSLIDDLEIDGHLRKSRLHRYLNVVAKLPADKLAQIAERPDVVSIQAYGVPTQHCERQGQIVAGNLNGNVPSGPGYLQWLASKGFTQEQFAASGFSVDLTDSGIDNGTLTPNHFALWEDGVIGTRSRITYSHIAGFENFPSTLRGCDGHGTIDAHIIGGFDQSIGFPFEDSEGFNYGMGICPFVNIGVSVVFDPAWTWPDYGELHSQAYENGARISSNSWGFSGSSSWGVYDFDAQAYDFLVRDAQSGGTTFGAEGNQQMIIVFSAGNEGPGLGTVTPPALAKNVICVGAAEGVQPFGSADFCNVGDSGSDSANDIIHFSSRGPCLDGRSKPDIMAPGTHISGGVAQNDAIATGTGGADLCFDATGVCGGGNGSAYWPQTGQQFYTACSGTSQACPAVAGGCALIRQFFINQGWEVPSPALTKALLINAARYMTGDGANDTLWSDNQGMGMMNLGEAFDRKAVTPTRFVDQSPAETFTESGQTHEYRGTIADTSRPFRVTLAWTDAPGATFGAAYNNDLDLTVVIDGETYLGNVFDGDHSIPGGSADLLNNVESVFIPAGVTGAFTVTVTAANINSDGVPGNDAALDQDFALVVYNSGCPEIALTESEPAAAAAGEAYSDHAFVADGGTGAYAWEVIDGALAEGMSVSSEGVLSGAPTEAGTFEFSIQATDAEGCTATASVSLTVEDSVAPAIEGCPENVSVTVGTAESCAAVVSWTEPTVTDNAAGPTIARNDSAPANGDEFPEGDTVVAYQAVDTTGNLTECTFTVTVTKDVACNPEPGPGPGVTPGDACGEGSEACGGGTAASMLMMAPLLAMRRRRSRRTKS